MNDLKGHKSRAVAHMWYLSWKFSLPRILVLLLLPTFSIIHNEAISVYLKTFFPCSQNAGATKKELPIVEEVTSVLREWGSIWKELYVVNNCFFFHCISR